MNMDVRVRLTTRHQFFIALSHLLVGLLTILEYFTGADVRFVVPSILLTESLERKRKQHKSGAVDANVLRAL